MQVKHSPRTQKIGNELITFFTGEVNAYIRVTLPMSIFDMVYSNCSDAFGSQSGSQASAACPRAKFNGDKFRDGASRKAFGHLFSS